MNLPFQQMAIAGHYQVRITPNGTLQNAISTSLVSELKGLPGFS